MARPTLLLALCLLPGLLAAQEKVTVYRTTGADGVNSYSQIAPPQAEAMERKGDGPAQSDAAAKAEAEQAEAPAKDPAACAVARRNLQLLASGQRLQRDTDNDGVPEDLDPAQVAAERDVARQQVATYCD